MLTARHTPSARRPDRRALLAAVTLALVVLTCMGIQSVANRFSAQRQVHTMAQASARPGSASARSAAPAGQPSGDSAGFGYAIVVLGLVGGGTLVSRARSGGARHRHWDDLPW